MIKLIKIESRVEVTRGWRKRGPGSQCLLQTEFHFRKMKF